jgi:hypothetical protein
LRFFVPLIVGIVIGMLVYVSVLIAFRLIERTTPAVVTNSVLITTFVSEAALATFGLVWSLRRARIRAGFLVPLTIGLSVGMLLSDVSGLIVGWMTAIPGAGTFPG